MNRKFLFIDGPLKGEVREIDTPSGLWAVPDWREDTENSHVMYHRIRWSVGGRTINCMTMVEAPREPALADIWDVLVPDKAKEAEA
jgi:hypothetical protein